MGVRQFVRNFAASYFTTAKKVSRGKDSAKSRFLLESLEDRTLLTVPAVWTQRGSGGGGALFSPSFGYGDSSQLFISSDMSQLFHSANTGQSWETLSFQEIQGNRGTRVAVTNNPNIMYTIDYTVVAGEDLARPTKSTDGGVTWTPIAADPTDGGAFSIFVDPANPNTVLVSDYTHLYISTNGGGSFALRYTTADNSAGLHIAGAFFDGNNIYVGTGKGFLKSTNGGTSFALGAEGGIPATKSMVSFSGAKVGGTVRLFAVTMGSSDVYAGVSGDDFSNYQGIYTLDVGNANWVQNNTGIVANDYPVFIATATNDINTAYVAGGSFNTDAPIVYKTTNGGATWTSVLLTVNNQNVNTGWQGDGGDRTWGYGGWAMGLAVAPTDSSRAAITDYGFGHVTTNGGTTWQQAYVAPADQNPLNAKTPKGKAYHDSGLDNTAAWYLTWADQNTMFASNTDIKGQRSIDAGQTWSFNYTGHTQNTMYQSIVHPTTGVMYGATSTIHDIYQTTHLTDASVNSGGGQVLFSSNKGSTWQVLHDFGHPVIWVAADPTNANRLYASVINSTDGGIWVSNNIQNGAASTWTKLAAPPRTEGHPFNIRVLNDGTIVASYSGRRTGSGFTASSGVFVSTNGGASWQDRTDANMVYYTKDIVIDPYDATQNTWYAGVWSGWGGPPNDKGGLYKTTNRGQTWTRVFTLDRVSSLTISPNDPNEAYMTTETDGLWHTTNLNNANPTFTRVNEYPFRQPERVFYNPFNSHEIWVTSFGNGLRVGSEIASGTITVASATLSVNESGPFAAIVINRASGSTGSVTVQYATANGTALAGSDYTSTNGTLTFADGETTKTINVPITDDAAAEGNENFTLTISNATGGASLGSTVVTTVTIVDNDSFGSIALAASTININESGPTVGIVVNRTGGSAGSVTIQYATANGTALAGSDYTQTSGTLTFADGETTKTINIPITNDALVEATETFMLTLSNPGGGATLGAQSSITVSIIDNEIPGTIALGLATMNVNESGPNAAIVVNRTGGSDGTVTVQYATSNGTALAGSDYTQTTGTLTFAPGETTKTINVPITNDALVEATETFTLTLSNPTGGATLGAQSSITVSILDDEVPGTIALASATMNVDESGANAAIVVNRTGGSDGTVTIQYATSNGTAMAGSDYTSTSGTLTFAPGETTKTINVPILNDAILETTESFTLALSNPGGGATLGAQSSITVSILDDEVPGTIALGATTMNVSETGSNAAVVVNRTGGSAGTVTIQYTTANGTALAGSDYTLTSGTLTFAPGETTKTINVPITNDSLVEPTETFSLTLSNPTGGATLGAQSSITVSILDNEVPGTIGLAVASITVNESDGNAAIVVNRTGGSDGTVTIQYATANGTATAGSDYTQTTGTLTFAPGETTKTINVPITNDTTSEPTETFTLTLSNPTGGATLGSQNSITVSILNTALPGTFVLAAPTISVSETGVNAAVVINRTGGSDGTATIQYATTNGTATSGTDYTTTNGTLTFGPGETTKTINVPILNDSTSESTEAFTLTLSNPTGGAALGAPATTTISIQDDDIPGTISLASATINVSETGPSVAIVVNRTNGSDGVVTVAYTTANGSALAGSDYALTSGTLTFANGETTKTINVPITNDSEVEATETFTLSLSNVTGGATLGATASVTVSILDNDVPGNAPPIAEANGPYLVNEGSPVTLSGAGSSDPENDSLTYAWDLNNDGVFDDATGINPVISAATLQTLGHADDGSFTAKLQVDDGHGHTATDTATIQVQNAVPNVNPITGPSAVLLTRTADFSVSFTDSGVLDTHSASIDWGDGTKEAGVIVNQAGVRTISGNHIYSTSGSYVLKVSVTDDDNGTSFSQKTIDVKHALVLDDPATGGKSLFVIGNETADAITAKIASPGTSIDVIVNGQSQGLFDPAGFSRIVLDARGGNDSVSFDSTVTVPASLTGGAGNDTVVGGSANDTVLGGDGDDLLFGMAGADSILGGIGNDAIDGGVDNDTILGESGNEYIVGGTGADSLLGGDGADGFDAGDGNDFIDGGLGNDFAYGMAGNDTILGQDGADGIDAGAGNDLVDGGVGNDFMYGLDGADTLLGNDGDDGIDGGAGDDSLVGGNGNDLLFGAAGNDSVFGGAGNDSINGDAGNDTLDGGTEDDLIFSSGGGIDLLFGGLGNDTLQNIDSAATLFGGAGNDMLYGANFINDSLSGEEGNDTIFGLSGNDSIASGAGADVIDGGLGTDAVTDATAQDVLFNVP